MPPTWIGTPLTAFVLAMAALVVGCGADSGPPLLVEEDATTEALVIAEALGSAEAERELERRAEAQEVSGEFPRFGFRNPTGRLTAIERMRNRAFDTRFQKTPFDKAIDKLPFREPPLRVRQWVMTDRSPSLDSRAERERFYRMSARAQAQALVPKLEHKLYARVDEDEFYGMSERGREAAVKAFYRDAEKLLRKAGIRDFVLVVTPLTETLEQLPELAVGRDGSASLTPLGRARPGGGV